MARKPKSIEVASTSKLDKPTPAPSTATATAGLLSDSASDSDSGAGSSSSGSSSSSKAKQKKKNKSRDRLSLNQSFATSYKLKKQTEELSKLQDKYGTKLDQLSSNGEEDSEASTVYSDDDSDAELVTPQVDVAIFKTLAKIRNKDPAVYEPQKMVFEEEEKGLASTSGTASTKPKPSSSKPVLLKDYQLQRVLADPTHSQIDDESIPDASFQPPTYAQQEQALKEQVKQAFFQASDSDDHHEGDDDDDFLVKRTQTKDEAQKEQDEYAQFLKTNLGAKAVKEALHEEEKFLNESVCTDLFSGIHLKADPEARFLLSYLLHRGWIDPKARKNRIPSYKEITGGNDNSDDEIEHVQSLAKDGKKARQLLAESVKAAALKAERAEGEEEEEEEEDETRLNPGLHDSSDSEFEEQAEEFEHKYNFRFEEAQGADLVTHSRTAMSSLRKPTTATTARQRAREAAKTKKEQEKLERKEEVRRLKALKRKEVEAKLAKLIEAAGEGTKGLDAIDLEGDWDEAEHDRKMQEIYGEDYDQGEDEGFKPTWDDDIDIGDIEEVGDDELGFAHGGDDGDEAMEGDYDEDEDEDDEDGEKPGNKKSKRQARREARKKRKGRDDEGLPVELLEAARQSGDEARKRVVDAMVDDYYALDYEDKVGDIATRFKYAKVEPTGYNLTAEEILLATDAELNQFMSLKKLAPYRRSDEEKVKASKQKKRLKELRDSIKARKWGDELPADGDEPPRKRKKYSQETGGSTSKEGGAPKKKRAGKSERKRKGKSAGTSEAGDDAE
ncbi:BZ3500_MvSof-1268-A1-R1_Chr1-3g02023 [Microbotryum saponariae]|uniref:BZ3500_MvSof-1268-A1-R1_Chr1-3g02023 protein n=1 Tax=Microbotryum saponariae TaxID=289078 RepID=A0A2X0MF17_9BASI|nr:BZ3500_MvSof-1268-A1-R1_Chr1-3g02023 [Microbotryum saponariae]SCZ95176.1 BZ3501_MvSof-1269-A2-R1_Chr1-3g01625 [Microbotryum saponariae]